MRGLSGHSFLRTDQSGGRILLLNPRLALNKETLGKGEEALMETLGRINRQMGQGTVGFAAAGIKGKREWAMQRTKRSARYTTRWDELPVAKA